MTGPCVKTNWKCSYKHSSKMLKVVCFKWNHTGGYRLPSLSVIGQYTAAHVNNMYRAVQRHTTVPHEFICITDDPEGIECKTLPLWDKCRELGGCYNRLYVFSEDMREIIGDRFICIDLDCVIVGSLDALFSRDEDFIINRFYGGASEQYYNGGLFMMNAGARKEVWERFIEDIPKAKAILDEKTKERKLLGTDQAWISYVLDRGEAMFDDEDDGVMAYLRNKTMPMSPGGVGRTLPPNACMVLFAGKIDPMTEYYANEWIQQNWGTGNLFKLDKTRRDLRLVERKIQNMLVTVRYAVQKIGYVPNLMAPESLTEKVLWRKHFCKNPLMPVTADKAGVKEYLKGIIDEAHIIPTLWTGTNPQEIPFDDLPQHYIIKPTHMSGRYIIVDRDDANISRGKIQNTCREWMKMIYGTDKYEWHYSKIPPAIIIEPLIGGKALPFDYKFHVLNGRWEWCYASSSRAETTDIRGNYDRKWNKLNVYGRRGDCATLIPKPTKLKEMGKIAEKLAKPFDYARIDLYEVDEQIYFGEITHFPQSGFEGFIPIEFDFIMGKKLTRYAT